MADTTRSAGYTSKGTTAANTPTSEELGVLEKVLQALREIRYGSLQITIQDGRVVQIDRTEKQRL